MKLRTTLLAALVVVAAVATPAAAVLTTDERTDAEAYAGTHVEYDVEGDAVVDYAIDGETMVDSMAVESKSDYKGRTDASGRVDLGTVVTLDGLGLSVASKTTTQATVESEGSASIVTHDNEDGTFVVKGGDGEQFVEAELASGSEAEAESDDRVVVTTANGTTGAFIVVGDGTVTVNEDGHVSAALGEDARLIFRESGEERSDDEKRVERMIANGTATAEVYVEQQDGETVRDTVTYGQNTTVEAKQDGENAVDVTVERAESDGKVVVTHVTESAVGTVESLDVTVDGDAAAEASSYSALKTAANGGDESKYYVAQRSTADAEASATVLVGFNHFSERQASISGSETTSDDATDDGSSDASDGETTSDGGSMPGFGVTAALGALVAAGLVALRTRE